MKLRFDDGSFSGNYGPSQHAVSGRFDPKFPCVLRGIWRHTKSTATGRFTFRITAPKTFKGNWSSGEADPDVAGSSWTGTRLAAPVVALPKNISLSQLKLEQAKLRARLNSEYHKAYREKHLIGLAVTITRGCIYCTGGRIEKALDSGISQETLGALTDLVAAVNAGVVVRTVLQGLEGLSCDGPECA
ncbi:MAG TPA: hypothetical protein EYG19_08875 [Verrucomicrobia bacterium]|nr:hypothetical protein [Verrucomicrobiota bacterium]